jgi:hypothetical protein
VSLVAEVVAEGYFTLLKSASGESLGVQEQGHLEQGLETGFTAKIFVLRDGESSV